MSHTAARTDRSQTSLLGASVKGILIAAGALAIANLGRKLAVQAPTAMAGDWCDGLIAEHKATLVVIDKLEKVSAEHPAKRAMLLTSLTHMVTKHALQEEQVIYPMLRRQTDADIADALNGDHGAVKAQLYELAHMGKHDSAFGETLAALRSNLEAHMREEEDVLFPALRTSLSDEKNRTLSQEMNMAGLLLA